MWYFNLVNSESMWQILYSGKLFDKQHCCDVDFFLQSCKICLACPSFCWKFPFVLILECLHRLALPSLLFTFSWCDWLIIYCPADKGWKKIQNLQDVISRVTQTSIFALSPQFQQNKITVATQSTSVVAAKAVADVDQMSFYCCCCCCWRTSSNRRYFLIRFHSPVL